MCVQSLRLILCRIVCFFTPLGPCLLPVAEGVRQLSKYKLMCRKKVPDRSMDPSFFSLWVRVFCSFLKPDLSWFTEQMVSVPLSFTLWWSQDSRNYTIKKGVKNQTPQENNLPVFSAGSAEIWNFRKLYLMSLHVHLVLLCTDLCFLSREISQH